MRNNTNPVRLLLAWSWLLCGLLQAQPKKIEADSIRHYPEVGDANLEFALTNIRYFSKKEASLADFKGKWLIVDFWTRWCPACIASFPKVDELKKKFEGKVQFILV